MPIASLFNPLQVQGGPQNPMAQQLEGERLMRLAQAMEEQQIPTGPNNWVAGLTAILKPVMAQRNAQKGQELLAQSILGQQTAAREQKMADLKMQQEMQRQGEIDARKARAQWADENGVKGPARDFLILNGKLPESYAAQAKKTPAQMNAEALGLQPGSPEYNQYLRAATEKRGQTINVNTPANYTKPFDAALAKADVGMYQAARDRAQTAQETLNSLGAINTVLEGIPTGKPQEFYGKLSQYFGGDAGADFQTQQTFVNEQVNNILNAAKGPQTDQDAERARASIPSMGTDPRARKVVMDYLSKKLNGQIQYFNEMDAYVNDPKNSGLRGFTPQTKGFDIDITPLARQGQQAGGAGGAGGYKAGDILTHNGKRYRVTGGDPNDPDVEEIP